MAKKLSIEEFLMPFGYAAETLINGNVSHCIEYLNDVLTYGSAGLHRVIEELEAIKETTPEKYEYVKARVIMPDEQKFHKRNNKKAFNK